MSQNIKEELNKCDFVEWLSVIAIAISSVSRCVAGSLHTRATGRPHVSWRGLCVHRDLA